jgi:hypothetical protein
VSGHYSGYDPTPVDVRPSTSGIVTSGKQHDKNYTTADICVVNTAKQGIFVAKLRTIIQHAIMITS